MTNEQKEILLNGRGARAAISIAWGLAPILVFWETNSAAWAIVCLLALLVVRFAPTACHLDELDTISGLEAQQGEGERKRGGEWVR